jgi:hypothetical protein
MRLMLAIDSCSWMLQVTMGDFMAALEEVQPAFGANTEGLSKHMMHGIIDYGDAYKHLASTLKTLVSQVRSLIKHSMPVVGALWVS